MALPRWVGDHRYRLLNWSVPELQKMYTGYSRSAIKSAKHRWTQKLKEGKITMPPKPEGSPDHNLLKPFGLEEIDGNASYHVGYIKNSEGEIEYTKPLPSVKNGRNQKLSDFISQASPVRITYNRSKPIRRDHKIIEVFGDSQIEYRLIDGEMRPIHDERALAVVKMMCQEYQPDTIVNLGDTVDLTALSRFQADSDHFRHSMNPALERVHRMYAELKGSAPNSDIHEVDSNHNVRLNRFILKNAPELYGIRQAGSPPENYPAMTYPFLANLDAVGVTWHGGYGAAEYLYGDPEKPQIVFKHGNSVISNGSTSAKESKENPETHVVRGHGHRIETHYRTNRAGQYLGAMMVGCTCSIVGDVPSYKSAVDDMGQPVKTQENWQQGILLIKDYGQGDYEFSQIPIINGVAHHEGKVYDGNR